MEILNVPLGRLHAAEGEDAIRVIGRTTEIKTLKANIQQFGLLVPLLVRQHPDKPGEHIVLDGNRRLKVLQEIWAPEALVPVMASEDVGIGEALSANVMRREMNAADAYDAYARMVADGVSIRDVAAVFGKTQKEIRQILALAALDPSIKDKLRKDEIAWETAEALTLIRDPARQVEVLAEAGDSPWKIRAVSKQGQPRLRYALFEKERYKVAGGFMVVDLFAEGADRDDDLCADATIFWQLQNEAIAAEVQTLLSQGWAEVRALEEKPRGWLGFPFHNQIRKKADKRKHILFYSVSPEGRFEIEARVEPTVEAIAAAKKKAEKEKAAVRNGAGVTASHPVTVTAGDGCDTSEDSEVASPVREHTQALLADLRQARNFQVKEALAADELLASRFLLYCLLQSWHGREEYGYSPGQVSWTEVPGMPSAEGGTNWSAFEKVFHMVSTLAPDAQWAALGQMEMADLMTVFGFIGTGLFDVNRLDAGMMGAKLLQANPVHARAVFTPDEAFWLRTSRGFMLQVLGEILGPEVAGRYKNERVADLARRMNRWFTGDHTTLRWLDFGGKDELLPVKLQSAFAAWVPAILALPAPGAEIKLGDDDTNMALEDENEHVNDNDEDGDAAEGESERDLEGEPHPAA